MLKLKVFILCQFLGTALLAQNIFTGDSNTIRIDVYSEKKTEVKNEIDSVMTKFGVQVKRFSSDSDPIDIEFGNNENHLSPITSFKKLNNEPIEEDAKSITYALFIGVSDYQFSQEGFTDLDKPSRDAQELRQLLVSNYQFTDENSILLQNPNKSEILKNIETLARKIDANDNLLIFYAGHGYWDEFLKVGYWLANDAKIDDKSTWISNSNLRDYITAIPSKHTLLVTDACFSGGIFKMRSVENVSAYATSKLYQLPSRKALTSGTLTKVPDESVFIKYLMKRLDENQEAYLPVSQLFYSIRPAILNNSSTVPQLGVIQNTGDEGGEFVFIKR